MRRLVVVLLLTSMGCTGGQERDPGPGWAGGIEPSSSVSRGTATSCSEPGAFLDSDCRDYAWLVALLRAGGLKVVGDTGTALTAEAKGIAVNAGIAVSRIPIANHPVLMTVDGTRVALLRHLDVIFWNTPSGRQVWVRVHSPGAQLDEKTITAFVTASHRP